MKFLVFVSLLLAVFCSIGSRYVQRLIRRVHFTVVSMDRDTLVVFMSVSV